MRYPFHYPESQGKKRFFSVSFLLPLPSSLMPAADKKGLTTKYIPISTWLDFFNDRLAVAVSHLFDVQQIMGVAIMSWPEINKNPGATAATVHNKSVIQSWVCSVSRFKLPDSCQIPTPGGKRNWYQASRSTKGTTTLIHLFMSLH